MDKAHGRWVDGKCSNCGVDIPTEDAYDVIFGSECRFCYYCGARMDGGDGLMANYERMWNSLKKELQQLEKHYYKMRLEYAREAQPTIAAHFKERGDGVAEAIMYMDLAEDNAFDE